MPMSRRPSSPSHVSLPSIQEMFPEHLLDLPERPVHYSEQPLRPGPGQSPLRGRVPLPQSFALNVVTKPSLSGIAADASPAHVHPKTYGIVSPSEAAPRSPFSASSPHVMAFEQRVLSRDDDKRHVCDICSKAFNRPSSLAIHVNTHTGAKPFSCPFPGCGRRFNVNSNMRRHLRNHSSPATRLSNLTPYTYPLTTCPRNLTLKTSSSSITSASPPSSVSSSPRVDMRHVQLTDSEDDSDSFPGSDFEEVTCTKMNRLRLRSRSSPGVQRPPPASKHEGYISGNNAALVGLQRSRSSSCVQPGCRCGMTRRPPAALHPSESQRLRK